MSKEKSNTEDIHKNYNKVVDRVCHAALKSGRNLDDIRLVVVTKTQTVEAVRCVIDAGASDLGENYVDEAIEKINIINEEKKLRWHMIGHLQSRKAQVFCQYFQYLHSLDSVKLAKRIDRFALESRISIPVWMEFNVAGEETKSGWDISDEQRWASVLPDIEQILDMKNLEVLGVMTVPPFLDQSELSRPFFRKLRKFQEYVLEQLHPYNFRELSIGMSSDFEIAIQEGSTCVRIGQAIFGPRS